MIYEFKEWLHPRDRLGRFREVLGSLKPGDGVRTQNAIVSRRRGGTFRVAPRGKRPVDTRSVDFAARAGLTGLTGSQEMTPAQKKKQTERVKDSLLRTVDKPAKGPYTPGMEPTMRVAASPGTIATPSAAEYKDYKAFMDRLDSHDWFYSMSDSQGVWRAGEIASADLAKEANSDPIKAAMYADYKRHKFTGPAWGNEKEPKPELSNYVSAPEDTSPIQSGDRVIDPDSGRTGTYQMSRMAGTPSIRWDDDPDNVEVYYEGALEKLPEPPRSPGTTIDPNTNTPEIYPNTDEGWDMYRDDIESGDMTPGEIASRLLSLGWDKFWDRDDNPQYNTGDRREDIQNLIDDLRASEDSSGFEYTPTSAIVELNRTMKKKGFEGASAFADDLPEPPRSPGTDSGAEMDKQAIRDEFRPGNPYAEQLADLDDGFPEDYEYDMFRELARVWDDGATADASIENPYLMKMRDAEDEWEAEAFDEMRKVWDEGRGSRVEMPLAKTMTDRQFMRDGVKFQIIGVREVDGKKMYVAVDADGNEVLTPITPAG